MIVLEIWTNGGVTPEQALKEASSNFLTNLSNLNDIIQGFSTVESQEEDVQEVEA